MEIIFSGIAYLISNSSEFILRVVEIFIQFSALIITLLIALATISIQINFQKNQQDMTDKLYKLEQVKFFPIVKLVIEKTIIEKTNGQTYRLNNIELTNIVDVPIMIWNVNIYDIIEKEFKDELIYKDILHLQTMENANFPILIEPKGNYYIARIRTSQKFSNLYNTDNKFIDKKEFGNRYIFRVQLSNTIKINKDENITYQITNYDIKCQSFSFRILVT